jgi:proline racemase
MSTGKIIGYVVAGILLFFGVLWLLSAFSADTPSPGGRLLVGGILVLLGLGIIVAVRLREPKPEQKVTIHQEIELGGDVNVQELKCRNCGSQLDKDDITVVEGAVMVSCSYCGAAYQIVEEPKW